jgi:SAM-dependent methyltransferase
MGGTYDTLASVYDFLVPEQLLHPAGAYAAFAPWLDDLPEGADVLDCACGPGHLAVGLAQAGYAVSATDASIAMTRRARALAGEYEVPVAVRTLRWEALDEQGWEGRFLAVFCVGNSLAHAAGREARRDALANFRSVLDRGGRLLVTSRNWELLREAGAGLAVEDRIVNRDGRRALVIYDWGIPEDPSAPHSMEVAVAVLPDAGDTVELVSERFDLWPFRHDQLIEDLAASGLAVETSTFADDVDRYLVVAYRR